MGEYYFFKVSIIGDMTESKYEQVSNENLEYIKYNNFLIQNYGTTIEENEDYIALVDKQSAIMILNETCFDQNELEDVFEILYDNLYMNRGERFEENNNCKRSSKIG